MKVEIAGAVAFAGLGLLVGALLRPQPDDFRPQIPEMPAGFTGTTEGSSGGADPTGGWGGRGLNGALPDYVVGTDSLQPPPVADPPPAWEPEGLAEPLPPPAEAEVPATAGPPPEAPATPSEDALAPAAGLSPATPPEAAAPSPSPAERPKEGE
ncbi:hypothetical protein [Phenylobacterium sp.]|uniref:hypothetical protein n=1 Tax=Phenylobacterium sp. TaxID=1871053 RepID=UPI0037C7DD69